MSRWAFWAGAIAAAGAGFWYFHFYNRVPGVEVGAAPLPGALELELSEGDQLRFTTQSEIWYRLPAGVASSVDGILPPRDCQLAVELTLGEKAASARCAFYYDDSVWSINTDATEDTSGDLRHARTWNTRTTCLISAPASGHAKLSLRSNLESCVPRFNGAGVRVYRKRPR
jgi:hypothetical protein